MLGSILLGCVVSLLVWTNLSVILTLLGATPITMADCQTYAFWWLIDTPVVIGKELFTYFIRVDGSPTYSFLTALAGGILNIILDYVFVGRMQMGILGASLATILGLCLSFVMGVLYFVVRSGALRLTRHGLSARTGLYCMVNGASEFINQLAIAITTIVFNRTAMVFAGEDGIAAVSIIMYLQFLCIGIYFGFSMGLAPPLGYAYGDHRYDCVGCWNGMPIAFCALHRLSCTRQPICWRRSACPFLRRGTAWCIPWLSGACGCMAWGFCFPVSIFSLPSV